MTRSTGVVAVVSVVALAVIAAALLFVLLNQDGQPSPSVQPSSTPEVTPGATLNQELLGQRLTVLFIGLDSNEGREARGEGVNTDTLLLGSVSGDQSEVTLISLPRDTVDIPMPDGSTWPRKVNGIYAQEGVTTLVGAMEALFAVDIHGYAQIDMDDLPVLVDAVGGVDVTPEAPLVDPIVDLELAAGPQTLDGETALGYVRTRIDTDYGRAARQQEVLIELVRRLVDPEADVDVASLFAGFDSFETDLPLDDLLTLLEIGRRAQDGTVTRQVLEPPEFITFEGNAGDGRGYILIPDVEAIRAFAAETIGAD